MRPQYNQEKLVSVNQLQLRRGDFELRIDDWSVEPGHVVGLVGANGAGKSTLLNALAGFMPARGAVQVFGVDPFVDPEIARNRLGFMSDDMPIFSVRVDRLLRRLAAYYPSWDWSFCNELLERFAVDPRAHVTTLSKGEGTRIRLVTALAFKPQVVLLDEPAVGLDLTGRRALLSSILEVIADPKRSVVVSSHALHDLERLADQLLVLQNGKVLTAGDTDQLIGDQQTLEEACLAWGLS